MVHAYDNQAELSRRGLWICLGLNASELTSMLYRHLQNANHDCISFRDWLAVSAELAEVYVQNERGKSGFGVLIAGLSIKRKGPSILDDPMIALSGFDAE